MKINSIQVLRAIAVIMVTYVHAITLQSYFSVSFQQNFYYLKNLGAIGVDLFFVISGFIICHVAGKYSGIKDGLSFLKKRFLRINPIYYFLSLVYFTLMYFSDTGWQIKLLLIRLLNSFVLIPVANIQWKSYAPILAVGWSLNFEWLFYLIFFTTILLRIKNKPLWLTVIIVSLVIIGRIYHPNFFIIYYTHPLLLEFLFGVVIYRLYQLIKINILIAVLLSGIGVAGLIFNIFHDYGEIYILSNIMHGDDQLSRVLLWGVPCLFIFTGSLFIEKAGYMSRIWNNPTFLLLGDASFSIYLCHYIINYILMLIYRNFGFFMEPDISIFFIMLVGILSGVLFYLKFEKPVVSLFHSGNQKLVHKPL